MRRGLLASREELLALRGRLSRKPFDLFYEVLRKRCSLILETQPVSEARWRSLWQQGIHPAALQAARTAQGRIFDLLIAHHLDRNVAYRDRAAEELKCLIGWSTWVDPASGDLPADLCTAEAAVAAVVGLDWLWDDLNEPDRLRVLQALRHKVITPYRQGVSRGAFWYHCYHSWNAIVNSGCGLAALALGDEEPLAEEAFHQASAGLTRFLGALGREGGWDEGTGPWGHSMRGLLILGEACRRLLGDRRLLQARGMDATGLFPVYFSPNGLPAGFGSSGAVPLYGALYLLVQQHGLRELAWWLDTYAYRRDADVTGWASVGLAMLLRPIDADSPPVPQLTPVKVFHEIGWAALADAWPRPTFYVAARSGELAAHGSRPDMNSLQLQVDGEMLLNSPGDDADLRAHAPQTAEVARLQTPLHNTLVVAQADHAIDAQGDILEAQDEKMYRWVACDAGNACGDSARFVRHMVMLVDPATQQGRTLVVLDDLELAAPERVDLFWHTPATVTLAAGAAGGTLRGRGAELHFALASTLMNAQVSTHSPDVPLPPGRSLVRLWGGAVGKTCLLSVFSRHGLGAKIEVKRSSAGDVRVKFSGAELHFKGRRKHLLLERVVVK
jgi:hypothetical protein